MTDNIFDYDTADFSSRAEVVAEVEAIAELILEDGVAATIEEARADAWSVDGYNLAELYQALPPDLAPKQAPITKSHKEPTLRDEIYAAARRRAELAQLRPGNFSKSIEQMVSEGWETREGSQAYNVYVSPFGSLPAAEALTTIHKSAAHSYGDALDIVRDWLSGS